MIDYDPTFSMTADHVRLLQAANLQWQPWEVGAPGIDAKRPYGNSNHLLDIAEHLGWNVFVDFDDEEHLTADQVERAERLHRETLQALQQVLDTLDPADYPESDDA